VTLKIWTKKSIGLAKILTDFKRIFSNTVLWSMYLIFQAKNYYVAKTMSHLNS